MDGPKWLAKLDSSSGLKRTSVNKYLVGEKMSSGSQLAVNRHLLTVNRLQLPNNCRR